MTKTLCGQYFLTTCMKFTSEISLQQPEHGFDPSPVWCDPYLPSTDISCRPQFRRFVPSFLCCFVFSLSIFEYPKLSLSPSVFLCLCSTLLLAVSYLSPLIFLFIIICFLFLLLSLSFSFLLSSTFFLCLSSVIFLLLFTLSFRVCVFYYYYYPVLFPFSTFQLLSAFSAFLIFFTFFFVFCFSYFVLFFYSLALMILS